MSLDDQIDTPAATNGNGTSGADEPGAMDEQYATFQASTAADDTAPPEPETGAGPVVEPEPEPEPEQDEELGADRSSRRSSSSSPGG